MSKVWQWILGILGVLVIIGVIAGAIFLWWNHGPLMMQRTYTLPPASGTPAPNAPNWQRQPGTPYGFNNFRRFRGDGGNMPMMRGFRSFGPGGFGPFGRGFLFFGGLLGCIIPLAVLVVVAIFFYWLGKRAALAANPAPPAAPTPDKTPIPGRRVAKS
jgi:hypothetical protein